MTLQFQKDKDFISLDLFEGRVRLQFFLGGSGKLLLETKEAYNDGKFYKIVASRFASNGNKIVLQLF